VGVLSSALLLQELHLVEAMTAQQLSNVGGCTDAAVVIPTPRVTSDVPYYENVYAASNCKSDTTTLVKVEGIHTHIIHVNR
jgi:hypothetical protein